MKVWIITKEWNGIQDDCFVYSTEQKAITAFEEKSGCSWESYINGDYDGSFHDTIYRVFECVVDED